MLDLNAHEIGMKLVSGRDLLMNWSSTWFGLKTLMATKKKVGVSAHVIMMVMLQHSCSLDAFVSNMVQIMKMAMKIPLILVFKEPLPCKLENLLMENLFMENLLMENLLMENLLLQNLLMEKFHWGTCRVS
jgi:hypothetical protein